MRKLFVAAATVAIFALLVTPAFAAKGGKPGGGGAAVTVGSSIDLCKVDGVAVNGCAAGQASVASAPSAHLRGTVSFAATAVNLAGWQWPMVTVWCYQDGNGDGIHEFPNDGGDLVYAQMDYPNVDFALGGGSSDWLTDGGRAECKAMLYAYGNKNPETIVTLASTNWFHAEG
jgi:hypothetical protein